MYDTLQTVSRASESKWFLNFLFSMPPKNSNLYSNMTSKINKWMDVWIKKKKKNCHENEPTILQMVEQVLVSWVTSVAHLLQGLIVCSEIIFCILWFIITSSYNQDVRVTVAFGHTASSWIILHWPLHASAQSLPRELRLTDFSLSVHPL